jgi:ABC-type iron transport system FetAB permease component
MDDNEDNESFSAATGSIHVATSHLVATAIPLVMIAAVGHHLDLGVENGLMVGIVRSFVQLMILGMILEPIFVLGMDRAWVVGLCEFVVQIFCGRRSLLYYNLISMILISFNQSQMYLQ